MAASDATRRGGCGTGRRRPTFRCRPMHSRPIPKSRSAETRLTALGRHSPRAPALPEHLYHGRPAQERLRQPRRQLDRHPPAHLHDDAEGVWGFPDAEEFQLFLEFRRAGDGQSDDHDRHRHLPGDELHRPQGHGLRQRRAHHARRELRLAAALRAPERRLDVLHRNVCAYLPRAVLRLMQGAARIAVDAGRGDPAADDGHRLHGLRCCPGDR